MQHFRRSIVLALVIGVVVGAVGIVVNDEVDRYTSTEAFCTSCHSMVFVANDPHYRQSAHRSNATGVHAGCADCHIPNSNWFVESYTHVALGLRDGIAELTHNYSDAGTWEKRRVALADEVRAVMRAQDSATCRSCHDPAAIQPKSEAGRTAHASLRESHTACIDCHINIVHAPPAKDKSS